MATTCPKCGATRRYLHRDHVIPKWMGGTDTPDNFQWLCANCHEDKTFMESQTPEFKAVSIRPNLGIKRSKATIQKLRQLARKRGKDPEYRRKQSLAHMGHPVSDVTKAKLSLLAKQRHALRGNPTGSAN